MNGADFGTSELIYSENIIINGFKDFGADHGFLI